jgi:predicted MFS family arabinose efflux permease
MIVKGAAEWPDVMRSEPSHSSVRIWLSVIVLGIASFTMVATEFAPVGLLSQIALDLGQDRATIGLTVTLYAWIGAGSGLLSIVLLNRFPRKPLLTVLMLVLAASNVAAMESLTFPSLLVARTLGAVVHGFFWAMVAAFATQIAPRDKMGLATSIVFGGISIANVVGVPLANLIGQASGWRAAFGTLGALGLLTALLMILVIPKAKVEWPAGRVGFAEVLRNRDLRGVYVVTALTVTAHFVAYTFVEPFLGAIPGIPYVMIAVLLFGFGAAGLAGNVLTGLLIDRFMTSIIALALLALCATLISLGWFGSRLGIAPVLALLVVWGAAIAVLFTGLQTWVLRAAGSAAAPAAAIHTAVLNAAIGIGATLGAWVLGISGLSGVMLLAGVVAVLPLPVILLQGRYAKQQ